MKKLKEQKVKPLHLKSKPKFSLIILIPPCPDTYRESGGIFCTFHFMTRLVVVFLFVSFFSVGQEEREVMYRIEDSQYGDSCGYVNENGDTLIPFGECVVCFSDSLNYAIVIK